jgi:hypothetical protein
MLAPFWCQAPDNAGMGGKLAQQLFAAPHFEVGKVET